LDDFIFNLQHDLQQMFQTGSILMNEASQSENLATLRTMRNKVNEMKQITTKK
jgi:hypothetical protein